MLHDRNLQTKTGEVRLKVPKLRHQTFETAIIGRYRRRESSVEEALIEMYLAGVSVRVGLDATDIRKSAALRHEPSAGRAQLRQRNRGVAEISGRRRPGNKCAA